MRLPEPKLINNLKYLSPALALILCSWDSDREKDEDRRESQFEDTRACDCPGRDWSNRDPEGRDRDDRSSSDDDRRGLHLSHDDSKD